MSSLQVRMALWTVVGLTLIVPGEGCSPSTDPSLTRNDQNRTAEFLDAAAKGNLTAVKALVDKGQDLGACDDEGMTALHLASREGHEAVAKFLLAAGADVNAKAFVSLNPAATSGGTGPTATLIRGVEEQRIREKSGFTPLHCAVAYGHEAVVRLLIQNGADVNALAKRSGSPLHQAVRRGDINIVDILLEKGAEPNTKSDGGVTPTTLASALGRRDLLERLTRDEMPPPPPELLKGAQERSLIDGLRFAARSLAAAKALLEKGTIDISAEDVLNRKHVLGSIKVDVNTQDKFGRTLLWWAATYGDTDVVEFLLSEGADPDAVDGWGGTALSQASEEGHTEVITLIEQSKRQRGKTVKSAAGAK
jgi:ankyrin repeat protein